MMKVYVVFASCLGLLATVAAMPITPTTTDEKLSVKIVVLTKYFNEHEKGGKQNGDSHDFTHELKFDQPGSTLVVCTVNEISNHQARYSLEKGDKGVKISGKVWSEGNFGGGGTLEANMEAYFAVPVKYLNSNELKSLFMENKSSSIDSIKGTVAAFANGLNSKVAALPANACSTSITCKHGGMAIDAEASRLGNQCKMQSYTLHGGDNQSWILQKVDGEHYQIKSAAANMVLDGVGAEIDREGCPVQGWVPNGNDQQKWKLEQQANGSYRIKNKKSNRYLAFDHKIDPERRIAGAKIPKKHGLPVHGGQLKLTSDTSDPTTQWTMFVPR